MRYALISDIHANLAALDAVLVDIGERGVDATHHLGDLVGYSSAPNEVIARLAERGITGVAGNYDTTVARHYKHCGCRAESPAQEALAHESFTWTLAHTSAASKAQLAALPFRVDLRPNGGHVAGPTVTLVHATPQSNLVYVTEDRSDDFLRKMAESARLSRGDVLCFGHTHKPWHRAVDGIHFINTGSVGRPKDGDPRASYILLTIANGDVTVEVTRVAYDIAATAAGVRAAGLPEAFVRFLETGGAA
ncbi:MAG: metallophosphoesterase family protein [Gemmatimonadaceae bacterium]|nr:metallophosphoesterase family protein [Gemmatimonadaceae bacterium]